MRSFIYDDCISFVGIPLSKHLARSNWSKGISISWNHLWKREQEAIIYQSESDFQMGKQRCRSSITCIWFQVRFSCYLKGVLFNGLYKNLVNSWTVRDNVHVTKVFWLNGDQCHRSFYLNFIVSISCLPGEPEKSSHFWKFIATRVLHRFESFKF